MTTASPIEVIAARILIVDDLADNRELLELILTFDGFTILSAGSGEEALDLVASSDPVQLVLLDLMLPGIDGFEVTRRLKANPATRAIPVLILSALADQLTRARAVAAGAEDLLTKPLNRKDLCQRVRATLHRAWPNVSIVTK